MAAKTLPERLVCLALQNQLLRLYAWTPDSRTVFFSSNRSGTFRLYRRAIDQAVPEVLVEGRFLFLSRLNPDGPQILFVDGFNSVDPALPQHILSVPLQGGTPRVVLQWPSIHNIQCARSPSKLCLFDSLEGSTAHFFTFDPEDGKTQEFATFKVTGDGKSVLVLSRTASGAQMILGVEPNGNHRVLLEGDSATQLWVGH